MNRKVPIFLLFLVTAVLVTACSSRSSQQKTTPPPAAPTVGVIDMRQAVQAHPKYSEHEPLQKAITTLEAQLAAAQTGAAATPTGNLSPAGSYGDQVMSGIQATLEQEYQAKMTAKQNELTQRLEKKAAELKAGLDEELKAYTTEVEPNYQPQIFNLQLKMKTVQLSQEELDSLRKQMETLQKERDEKIAAKNKELADRLTEQMKQEQASANTELNQYAEQLRKEQAAQAAAKQQEAAARIPGTSASLSMPSGGDPQRVELERQLAAKQQELRNLEATIVEAVRDKAAQIATAKGLSAVLTNVNTNISAVDITSDVIAEFKKP